MADPQTTEKGGRVFRHKLRAVIRHKSRRKSKQSEDIFQLINNSRGSCGMQRPQNGKPGAIINHEQECMTPNGDQINSYLLPYSHNFSGQKSLRAVTASTSAHGALLQEETGIFCQPWPPNPLMQHVLEGVLTWMTFMRRRQYRVT